MDLHNIDHSKRVRIRHQEEADFLVKYRTIADKLRTLFQIYEPQGGTRITRHADIIKIRGGFTDDLAIGPHVDKNCVYHNIDRSTLQQQTDPYALEDVCVVTDKLPRHILRKASEILSLQGAVVLFSDTGAEGDLKLQLKVKLGNQEFADTAAQLDAAIITAATEQVQHVLEAAGQDRIPSVIRAAIEGTGYDAVVNKKDRGREI